MVVVRGLTLQPQLAPTVGIVFASSAHPDIDPEPQIDEKSITHGCFKFRHSDLALIFSQEAIRGMFPPACVDPGQ